MADLLLNKVAVVTGAGSGIGAAIAKQFLHEGAKVILVGRNRETLENVASTAPARSHVQLCDVTHRNERSDLVTTTVRKFGRVDLLVPCAGTMIISNADFDTESLESQLLINCNATYQSVTVFRDQINRHASVIFFTAGGIPPTTTLLSAWLASKFALKSLAISLTQSWKAKSIRVNCLAPRPTQTPCWQQLDLSKEQTRILYEQLFSKSMEKQFINPDLVAQAAVYLASDNSLGIRGQEIIIDN